MTIEFIVSCDKCGKSESTRDLSRDSEIFSSPLKDAHKYLRFYDMPYMDHLCYKCAYETTHRDKGG